MRWMLLAAVALLVAGCTQPGGGPSTTPTPGTTPSPTPLTPTLLTQPPFDEPRFDGERAYEHVVAQVTGADGSPRFRVPGTEGNAEVARYVAATMTELGYDVAWHHFNATYGCVETPMHNVVATRSGTSGRTVVFAAHYDTRPVADKDPDGARRSEPILGANDGASGVGVLLELARVLVPSEDHVRFLFFDGEDGGGYKASEGCDTDWILGSRAYADQMSEADVASVRALVLVDMVGDADLTLPREGYTAEDARARAVQDDVYAAAHALGHAQFLDETSYKILDDHVPFLEREIPAVDLIHLIPDDPRVFPAWHHTHEDDLDSVSAASLDAVGETLESWFASSAG